MVQDFLIFWVVLFLLLLPIVFWMYIFVSFFPHGVSRKQFFIGSIIGAFSTLPFIYKNWFFSGNFLREIFFHLSTLSGSFFPEKLFLSLELFFLWIFLMSFFLFLLFQKTKKDFTFSYSISFFFLSLLIAIGVISVWYLSLHFSQTVSWVFVLFWDLLFVSVGSIISYYIIISFLEEWMKYIGVLGFSGREEYFWVFQKYICMSACIALGFAFFENILYVGNFISHKGITDGLISLVLFRSLFTIILHLMSSMLFAMGFWYIIHFSIDYLKHTILFILLSFLALASHSFFDVALSFEYIGYIFFYILALYFFLSYLVTRPL